MDELILQGHNAPDRGEMNLLNDICAIVDSARNSVAKQANIEIALMNWHIGERINREILGNMRAEYGKQIVSRLATQLKETYGGSNFNVRNLRRMMQFATEFPDTEIVSQLATQLSWSHFVEVLPLKEPLKREFYLTIAASEHWSRNLMREKIDGMLYERTAISGKPEEMISKELSDLRDNNIVTPDLVFKDPYFLDFTGLTGFYSEKDLEDVLISRLEKFLIELGNGFSFVARQKRMIIDGEDFYLDLLFFHRKLHRLIAVDLKTRKFRAQDKGQMELYLRYLDKYEKEPGEESPLGMLLCLEGSDEQIELLQLDEAGIKVARYFTELPSKDVLKKYIAQQKSIAEKRLEK
ncbi:MAG: PDDEXK nuclease domain-containing protein [Butyrivibrio sp.]|nr:PDDEXK nuclease domain-containing protein [Muribaculum sp.]MCM1552384.1 PDDEXK nuclease domain-containing protein [Butyrivibrio sp.]